MNRVASVMFVLVVPTAAFGQVVAEVDGGRHVGRVVVLGAVVELPVLDPPAPRRSSRCRPRPRLLTPMLVAHTSLQLADAHSTLRGLAAARSRGTRARSRSGRCGHPRGPTGFRPPRPGCRGGARASLRATTRNRRSGSSSPSTGSTRLWSRTITGSARGCSRGDGQSACTSLGSVDPRAVGAPVPRRSLGVPRRSTSRAAARSDEPFRARGPASASTLRLARSGDSSLRSMRAGGGRLLELRVPFRGCLPRARGRRGALVLVPSMPTSVPPGLGILLAVLGGWRLYRRRDGRGATRPGSGE